MQEYSSAQKEWPFRTLGFWFGFLLMTSVLIVKRLGKVIQLGGTHAESSALLFPLGNGAAYRLYDCVESVRLDAKAPLSIRSGEELPAWVACQDRARGLVHLCSDRPDGRMECPGPG